VHSYAQNGSLSGTVIDESNKETLVGATVMIEGLSGVGASTDIDGQYLINGIPAGTYTVKISSLSYDTKNISSVVIESGKTTTLDVAMEVSDTELGVVVIETDFRTETINSILTIQKNNIAISDGISKDIIQRSPDKNTGEVLKRMSGTTITDGKFVVIRGLSDRYNTAMINGNILPSTEPDRKNFSFDLFPSALLDNLFIYKSAQPDLPGDFAGGIIQMQTRDIPEEDFIAISAGTGYNFQSTFKPYYQYRGGEKDWLGIDDGTRSLPDGLPSTEVYNNTDDDETTETTDADRAEYSKLFGNYWGAIPYESTPLDQSYQLSGGIVKKLNDDKDKFGFIAALTYNNSYSTSYATRQDVDVLQSLKYTYLDTIYKQNILWGTLLNLSYKLGDKHKFSFKNSYSINATDNTTIRGGQNNDFTRYVDYEYYEFISNRLLTNVLSGESLFPNSTIKINWNIGINSLIRDQPDLRTSLYYKGFVPTFEGDTLYQTFVFYNPSPEGSYRFWSYLEENSKLASLDLSYPFIIGETPQAFKTGVQVLNKDRNFSARALGYSVNSSFYSNPEYLTYLTLPRDVIFSDQYLADSIFFLEDATLKSDSYTATQNNFSTYAMLDNKIKDLRIVWGVRAEFFSQTLNSFYNSSSTTPEPISVNSKDLDTIGLPFDLLPSINFIYSLTEKFNIRLSGSKTVTRPELRELAPFGYYDYESSTYVIGNPELLATDIYNGDLRFEYYPGKGQIVSASAFYKYFNNPIELRRYENTTYKQIDPINESEARNYGFEFELRKNFSFLGTNPVFEKLSFNTNLAYINSLVQVTDTAYYGVTERPLQGQSPYVVNAGLTYFNPDNGFSVTTLYNVIGRRITELGNKDYADIYENPRPLLDAQASIPMLKDAALLRITIADILNKDLIFYQDIDESGKYEEDIDNLIAQINTGNKLSLSFTYKF
jgi:hypothetical protein